MQIFTDAAIQTQAEFQIFPQTEKPPWLLGKGAIERELLTKLLRFVRARFALNFF